MNYTTLCALIKKILPLNFNVLLVIHNYFFNIRFYHIQCHCYEYDLNAILSDLVHTRILNPNSKRSSYKAAQSYLEPPSYGLHDVYRALSVLAEESDFLFLSLLIYRLLERELGAKYTCEEILSKLKEMNFAEIEDQGFMPLYERDKLTGALHDACDFLQLKLSKPRV